MEFLKFVLSYLNSNGLGSVDRKVEKNKYPCQFCHDIKLTIKELERHEVNVHGVLREGNQFSKVNVEYVLHRSARTLLFLANYGNSLTIFVNLLLTLIYFVLLFLFLLCLTFTLLYFCLFSLSQIFNYFVLVLFV